MADRNRRQRPARSRGLSKRTNPVRGRAGITSARARPRVTLGRAVASALVVAAALGGGVLVRDRLLAPAASRDAAAPVVEHAAETPTVEVASATAGADEADAEASGPPGAEARPPAEQAIAEPPSAAVAEAPSPPTESASGALEANTSGEVLLPTGAPPEPTVSTTTEPREATTTTATGQATTTAGTGQATTTAGTGQATTGGGQATTGGGQPASAGQTARAGAPTTPGRQVGARTYTVQPRDTLKGIAARYGVSIASILAVNDIPNPDSLRIGQVLTIP